MKNFAVLIFCSLLFLVSVKAQSINREADQGINFNHHWQFVKNSDLKLKGKFINLSDLLTKKWTSVSLPHTANLEPLIKTAEQWQGICLYRKSFILPLSAQGKFVAIQIDAAMNEADVYLNGKFIYHHIGGYLPFQIDISQDVLIGRVNSLLLRLSNTDNAEIPPGKPIKGLDFNYYSGIYRNTWLIIKDKVHISDAVAADHLNGGGLLVNYPRVTSSQALINIKCEVQNDNSGSKYISLKAILRDASGKVIVSENSESRVIKGKSFDSFNQTLTVINPALWSPDKPDLYSLSVYIIKAGKAADSSRIRLGIHTQDFTAGAFYLNNKKLLLRGTNRHQEYPFIGNALSDNAQYRDVYKIKQAGFNFVRCSHYPPSPAFLNACDELGILVMDSTPGWQFFGDETFQKNSLKDIRDMIHRDRNHASIALWEASLNETDMKREYMVMANAEVHTELPYASTFTAGWIDDVYDVFIPARQHQKAPDYWKKYNKDKPLLIAEYGDWEYYAQNAGFNQTEYQNLTKEEKSSRQIRSYGQERLLQQSLNYQEAHNDNLNGRMVGDLNWLMFDYKRGYASDTQTSGIMDIFRIPKFSYYFFQSQKDASDSKPMLFIANYWRDSTDKAVKIYSNCDEVELTLNGSLIGKQKADTGKNCSNLVKAPFTFQVKKYMAGTLLATGFIKNKEVISSSVTTALTASKIILKADYSGRSFKSATNDILFIYAYLTDKNGNTVQLADNLVKFSIKGPASIIGDSQTKAEAGIAPALILGGFKPGKVIISATAEKLENGEMSIDLK